jgi:hypothetical protein
VSNASRVDIVAILRVAAIDDEPHRNELADPELARAVERDHADALKTLADDPGWVKRDFMPPTLRPVWKAPS